MAVLFRGERVFLQLGDHLGVERLKFFFYLVIGYSSKLVELLHTGVHKNKVLSPKDAVHTQPLVLCFWEITWLHKVG